MRLFLLILLCGFLSDAPAQLMTGRSRMESFDPYRPVTGKISFLPDSIHPETVEEFDSSGNLVRHAAVRVHDGKWYIHGKDTLWGEYSVAIFTVRDNVPDGPFHYDYEYDYGEGGEYFEYRGNYRDGRIHGRVKDGDGSYFTFENGVLHGPYVFAKYYNMKEKGTFVNGYRHGKVSIYQGKQKNSTREYRNGYFLSERYHFQMGDDSSLFYNHPARLEIRYDTVNDLVELFTYNYANDTVMFQIHYHPEDMRSVDVYREYETFYTEYYYFPNKPERLRTEINQGLADHPGSFVKQVTNYYSDNSSDDSIYHPNSSVLHRVRTRNGSYFEFKTDGTLRVIHTTYDIFHNPVTCLYGIKDIRGRWVLEQEFEEIHWAWNHGFIAKKNGLFGLYNWKGEALIAPVLEVLYNWDQREDPVRAGMYPAYMSMAPAYYEARIRGKWGVIDNTGKWLIAPEYDEIDHNNDVVKARKGKENWLWKKQNDTFIRHPQLFEEIEYITFPIIVKQREKWGALANDLSWLVPPEYDHLSYSSHVFVGFFFVGKTTSGEEMSYWVLDQKGNALHTEPLEGRPNRQPTYIATSARCRNRSCSGIMTFSGKILVPAEYDRIERYWYTTTLGKDCFAPFYVLQKGDKWHLLDTTGKLSPGYWPLTKIEPYKEKHPNWEHYHLQCPQTHSFVVRDEGKYKIIDEQGRVQLDETLLSRKIDTIWVWGGQVFVHTPTRVLFYFSNNTGLFALDPNGAAGEKYSRLKHYDNECTFLSYNNKYGLLDSRTGDWLLQPEYESIEKRGEEYILRDRKGKITMYRRGEDNSWQKVYAMRYPVQDGVYIAYTYSGKAGLIDKEGKLYIDTVYRTMAFQASPSNTWYWAGKKEGMWDIYDGGKLVHADIEAVNGEILGNGKLVLTLKNRKKRLLDSTQKVLVESDLIILDEYYGETYIFRDGDKWGRYSPTGEYSYPALYDKVWFWYPFLAIYKGNPVILDSVGAPVTLPDSSVFVETTGMVPEYSYSLFCPDGSYYNGYAQNCVRDPLNLWQNNLLFLLNNLNMDIASHRTSWIPGFNFNLVYASGVRGELPIGLQQLNRDYTRPGKRILVRWNSAELMSTCFITEDVSQYKITVQIEAYTYQFRDHKLKRLYAGDIVTDEKVLESILLLELAKKNLPVEACPDLRFLYALCRDRFFLDETGITFLVEVSYEEQYMEVKVPYAAIKDILRKETPVYSIAFPN